MAPTETLAALVGGNCKRIRAAAGVTQDELARCARDLGLRWNSSKVGDFETGRAAPTFATVLTASLALDHALAEAAQARGRSAVRVTLADLLDSTGRVELNDELHFRGSELADVCRGNAWRLSRDKYRRQLARQMRAARETVLRGLGVGEDDVRADQQRMARLQLLQRSGLTEQRLAQRLAVSRDRLADVSFALWGHTFSDERDRRAGPDANKQKRGQVSRTLQAELEKALSDGED
ncbi:MAG: helix-turn-helix domain-containing protein [Mycobacterium sp.]